MIEWIPQEHGEAIQPAILQCGKSIESEVQS